MFVSVLFYSLIVGSITSSLQSTSEEDVKKDANRVIYRKILKDFDVPNLLKDKIWQALAYGTRKVEHNEQEFIDTLPKHIRIQLRSIIYKKIIKGIWFLEDKPD